MPLVDGVRLPEAKSLTDPWLMPSCCAASVCVQSAADSNMRKLAVKTLRLSEFGFDVDIGIVSRYGLQHASMLLFILVHSQGKQNRAAKTSRSEEHTSELQSLRHLVCR